MSVNKPIQLGLCCINTKLRAQTPPVFSSRRMIIRTIDQDGDWTFGNGIGSYRRNLLALTQDLETRLKEWVGDCFFNVEGGIDWYNRIGSNNRRELQQDIKVLILQTEGITGVINLSLDYKSTSRNLNLTYSITTIYSNETITNNITV